MGNAGSFILFEGVCLAFAALILVGVWSQRRRQREVKAASTSASAEIAGLAASVAKELGPGSFNRIVKVKGTIECAEPLVSDLSQTRCVAYSMKVTRPARQGQQASGPAFHNERRVPFSVRDASGAIEVDPDGATLVDEKVFSGYREVDADGPGPQAEYRSGSYTFDPASLAVPPGGEGAIYAFEETAIPVGRPVTVLGEAVDNDGRLRIRKPAGKGASFVVSLGGEEQLVKQTRSSSKFWIPAAIVLALFPFVPLGLGRLGPAIGGGRGVYIPGVALLLVAFACVRAALGRGRRRREMTQTVQATAAELADLAGSVAGSMGAGSFSQAAQIKGTIECARPLVSDLGKTECVYYSMSVRQQYEGPDTDNEGDPIRHEQVLLSARRSTSFELRDATGSVTVEPEGASFVAEKTVSRLEQGTVADGVLRVGDWSFDLGPRPGNSLGAQIRTAGVRTLGFALDEEAIPVGREAFVLGEATDRDGRLRVGRSATERAQFIVSLESAENLATAAQYRTKGLAIASVLFAAAGITCLILAALHVF